MTAESLINYPDQTDPAFNEIKRLINETPLSIARLQYLKDVIEQELKEEWDEHHLFTIGNQTRENVRAQFCVLRQALELNSIGVIRLRPERDNGELKWTITQRSRLVSAILVLRGTDDTWEIRPIPLTDRKRAAMTVRETQDTNALNALSLTAILFSQGVDLESLGGWELAS